MKELARKQIELYRVQPAEVAAHFVREQSVLDSYRGRQLLELLQNADDACEDFNGEKKLLFRLTKDHLIIANTGNPFTKQGIESLVISDNSPKQLKRTKYIGNKGLGFRAVLSWSHSPIVISGDFLVAFSAQYAKNNVQQLASEMPELNARLAEWNVAGRECPASIMRFPYVPATDDDCVKSALEIIKDGYNTVILLPLMPARRDDIYEEIKTQLNNISGEVAIFCYHIEQLVLQADFERKWKLIRDNQNDKQTLIIHDGHTDKLWTVYRKESTLPQELISHELRHTPEFEVAIAVPDETSHRKDHKLCVYFPTNEVLPMPILCHASLDTDDSRNRLVKHDANKYVLKTLGEFVGEIAEKETTTDAPFRGLELIAGIEKCDPELIELGLMDVIIEACKRRKIFYRLDGTFATSDEVSYPPHLIWSSIATAEYFPEILRLSEDIQTRSLLNTLNLSWYDDKIISRRLEKIIKSLPSQIAGTLIGQLIATKQLPKNPLPSVLVGESGDILPAKQSAFLPPETETFSLPYWVENFSFLNRAYLESVRNETTAQSVRDLRSLFYNLGYSVEEFQLENVARNLAEEAIRKGQASPENEITFHRDVLQFIFKMSQKQGELTGPIRVNLRVITTKGTLRRAQECYLGPDYPSGALVFELYGPLGADEFVAAPSALGLEGDINIIESFLIRIGVARSPRIEQIDYTNISEARKFNFIEFVLGRLEFPTWRSSLKVTSYEELRNIYRGFVVNNISFLDRFANIVENSNPAAIISYLATDGGNIFSELDSHAVLYAKTGSERKAWPFINVPIPNFILHFLRNYSWIPCDDGQKRRPNQIILSRAGGRALRGTFFNYDIDINQPILKTVGGMSAVKSVLLRLGAIDSLESLRPDDLYSMLLSLPKSDSEGQVAPSIYRTLIEQGGIETESYLRDRFFKEGYMWGKLGDNKKYFPVGELKYLSQAVVPKAVLREIPLVDIDLRRSTTEIKRIFNISSLRREDVSIILNNEATEYQPWSAEAQRHLKHALPFLYAFRLSKTVDETGKERRLFKKTAFNVCSRLSVKIALFGETESPVVIDEDAEGLVIDTSMFLVSHSTEFSVGDQVFLHAIGDLFSDLLGINISSDFAGFLGCDTERQMLKLLEKKVGGEASGFFSKAKIALEEEDEDISEGTVKVPPPRPKDDHAGAKQEEGVHPPVASGDRPEGDHMPEDAGFKPVEPPIRPQGQKKKLVVTGKTETPRTPGRRTVMVDESTSLKVVELFEKNAIPKRYPIRVEHIKGLESLGCDIVSVASEEAKKLVEEGHELNLADALRFIEVKGRSNRTGLIELTDNQLSASETFKNRYYLYRVFRDPGNLSHFELAVLENPSNSQAKKVIRTIQFDLSAGSGSEWWELAEEEE